jgi:hypothetical protein
LNPTGQVFDTQKTADKRVFPPSSPFSSVSRDELESVLRAMTDRIWGSECPPTQDSHPALGETVTNTPADTAEGDLPPGFSGLSREELEGILATVMDGLK